MPAHTLDRRENLDRLRAGETWDVVVIGGGATGLGTAVDAATRGYRTLLLESLDFAHGTSSRSTKLVHGGVRYLAQGNLHLVREALHERGLLVRNAPHLVHSREFMVPAYRYWRLPFYGIGLWLYDRLAGRLGLGRSRWASRATVVDRVPTIRRDGLRGGILYVDGQFDDARLAITLALTAVEQGASALNHFPVVGLLKEGGKLTGVRARDDETGEEYDVRARSVVNATGVYADAIRHLDKPDAPSILAPSQGAHIVLDRSFLPGTTAVMVPKTDDGRVLFAIPWHDRVLVGTTDVPLSHAPAEPRPLKEEIDFLIEHTGRYLEKAPTLKDVKSQFAGLRPLIDAGVGKGESTAKLSREHAVIVAESGLITVAGGKWTTYRVMARDTVDQASRVAGLAPVPCGTAELKLRGWSAANSSNDGCLAVYGADLAPLRELIEHEPRGAERLHPALPYVEGEVVWAVRHEAARSVEDVLARRTRALFLDARASIEAAPRVAAILARELDRDDAWRDDQVRRFRDLAATYLPESEGSAP